MKTPQPNKTPGLAVNKTREIRRAAKRMVTQGDMPRPKAIRMALEKAGIKVSSAQVSTALTDTEFAYRRNIAKWENICLPVLPDPLECVRQTSKQNLDDAEELVRKVGSIEVAIASLVALGQLKREPTQEQHHGGA